MNVEPLTPFLTHWALHLKKLTDPIQHVAQVAITETTIPVPYHVLESLQLICWSSTRGWNPHLPVLQKGLQWRDLKIGYQDSSVSTGPQGDHALTHWPLKDFNKILEK